MKRILASICLLLLLLIMVCPTNVQAISKDDILNGADQFLKKGGGEDSINRTINDTTLQESSKFLYNTLLGIGIIIAVIAGMILGIKYMLAGSEEKAEIKQTLPAYIVSCVVIFGAFTIWRFIISMVQ